MFENRANDGDGNSDARHHRDEPGFIVGILKCPIPTPGQFEHVNADAQRQEDRDEQSSDNFAHSRLGNTTQFSKLAQPPSNNKLVARRLTPPTGVRAGGRQSRSGFESPVPYGNGYVLMLQKQNSLN